MPPVALLGFSIQGDRGAPVAMEADFAPRRLPRGEMPGLVAERDAAGLTSPVLARSDGRRLPRPVGPLDAEAGR